MKKVDIFIQHSSSDQWMSSTDLMSGLMLVFMLIAISFMLTASTERDAMQKQRDEIKSIALHWIEQKEKIYQALFQEFQNDLPKWNAIIKREELIVRFREPRVLFSVGQSTLTQQFKNILRDFFPRYIHVLQAFTNDIAEIRIEGHTSSEWNSKVSDRKAYFKNLILSHNRSREVVVFCLSQLSNNKDYEWTKKRLVASGMSSSRIIVVNGKEDKLQSRRVDFRVRTNAEEKLSEILQH